MKKLKKLEKRTRESLKKVEISSRKEVKRFESSCNAELKRAEKNLWHEGLKPELEKFVLRIAKTPVEDLLKDESNDVSKCISYDSGPAKAIIFNHKEFDSCLRRQKREGTDQDVKRIGEIFTNLSVQTETFTNLSLEEIRNEMNNVQNEDFSEKSSIVIVILSHGGRRETIAARDQFYSADDEILFPLLKNRTLENKPKIIIIQACKGSFNLNQDDDIDADGLEDDSISDSSISIVCENDIGKPTEILKLYSTSEGFISMREVISGSIFIQTFCNILEKLGSKQDIRRVMQLCITEVKNITKGAQIPTICSNMERGYIFGKSPE